MIAEIQPSFSSHLSMSRKIEYQLSKVKEGNGKVLYTSTGDELAAMPAYMKLISQLNDRVKLPYAEFILSLYPGESLSDEQWLSLAGEYIERMGYGKSCYAVVLNTDKAHSHVHVLLTTIDEEGKSIPSGNNYSRSEKISRELEQKYGLLPLEREGGKRTTLGEAQYRNYYFDAALKKAMRSYNYKDKVSAVLEQSDTYRSLNKPLQEIKLANGVSCWGMKAMTTFSHCWKKEVFSTPCSRMNCYNSLTASTLFPKVHPISEGTWNKKDCICVWSPRRTNPIMSMASRIQAFT